MGEVMISATDLDVELTKAPPVAPFITAPDGTTRPGTGFGLPDYTPDFAALMRSITAATDTVSMLERNSAGRINQVAYRLGGLQASLAGVFNANGQPEALAWPIQATIQRFKSALHDLRNTLGTDGRTISIYTTRVDDTLASIASDIHADLTDLIRLNRPLMQSPIVKAGTSVRFYKAA
jgi:hypothetical protein